MKKIFMVLLCLSFSGLYAKGVKEIKFTANNSFAITSIFNEVMLENLTKKIMTYTGDEIYIYLDSPGGSVFAMTRMAGIMKSSKIKFICVARFAASAAFSTLQACDERYILPDGVIMQHNAAGMFWGELPRVYSLFKVIDDVVSQTEKETAKRLKMTYVDFKIAINNNLWLSSSSKDIYNAIDGVIEKVSCSKELVESVVKRPVLSCGWFSCTLSLVKYSGCPLLTMPIIGVKDDNPTEYIDLRKIKDPLKSFYHIAPGYRVDDSELLRYK